MSEIKTVKIEAVSMKDKDIRSGKAANGREWTMYLPGIKVGDQWFNGKTFNKEDVDMLKSHADTGEPCDLEFFEEEYNGKVFNKFKIPDQTEVQKAVSNALGKEVEKLKIAMRVICTEFPNVGSAVAKAIREADGVKEAKEIPPPPPEPVPPPPPVQAEILMDDGILPF